eukprot:768718-Hanusia_phi.AAC.2
MRGFQASPKHSPHAKQERTSRTMGAQTACLVNLAPSRQRWRLPRAGSVSPLLPEQDTLPPCRPTTTKQHLAASGFHLVDFEQSGSACLPLSLTPDAKFLSCQLNLTWYQLLTVEFVERNEEYRTGGMGGLADRGFLEVWVCKKNHECADGGDLCFLYDETRQRFYPWGLRSNLGLGGNEDL